MLLLRYGIVQARVGLENVRKTIIERALLTEQNRIQ